MRAGLLVKVIAAISMLFFSSLIYADEAGDPLPSWKEGPVKRNIVEFVKSVTDPSDKDFVPREDRVATIDNDGTLWVEQPQYPQTVFMLNRYQQLHLQPKNLSAKNFNRVLASTSYGMSVADYVLTAKEWLSKARHPRFQRLYTEMIYQPMLEMINYLHVNGFDVYIVTGGGQEFVRAFALPTYGISPDHVIGTMGKTKYVYHQNGKPVLMKTPQLLLVSNQEGKPEAINLFIGKKPIIAFGNSDGDRQMLEWTQSNPAKHLMLLVHHDDAKREYAYDTQSKVGTFSASLMAEAEANDWQVISMKDDWKVLFPYEVSEDVVK